MEDAECVRKEEQQPNEKIKSNVMYNVNLNPKTIIS